MNSILNVKAWLSLCVVVLSFGARGQSLLDGYVEAAIQNNRVLKQKNVSLEQSLLDLKEAKSYYQPSSWIDGQYILSQGGRRINLPVGDLLNPVYATLNQLTNSNRFPKIENAAEQLNPNNFYDLRIKTAMPLINIEIDYNKQVKQQQVTLRQQDAIIYTRELVKETKSGYYNILMAKKAVEIYTSALALVNENLRVSKSLLSNGKSLPAYVSRAEAEVFQVETQLASANQQVKKAEAWFNALLNRDMYASIQTEEVTLNAFVKPAESLNSAAREELAQINTLRTIQGKTLKFSQAYRIPKLNAFLDLAAQDFHFNIRSQSFFYLGGLQFSVPIYSANRHKLKIQQTQLDLKKSEYQWEDVRNQLDVAVFQAKVNVNTSYDKYLSSLKQEEAARQYFRLIERGYKEGVNSFIEWLDARNHLTQAQIQKEVLLYTHLTSLAELERETASFPISSK